jgi:glycosyltransferase involved in cell wall biosynthesis
MNEAYADSGAIMSRTTSALVRTFNSEGTLHKTLLSLRIQRPALAEVVVVDSGSTDGTLGIARHFGCRIIPYPKDRPFNYSESLNIGIAACAGKNILIISSHCVLCFSDVARIMGENLEREAASGVYCVSRSPKDPAIRRDDPLRGRLTTIISRDNFDGLNGLWNACSMIDRACWAKHPFDVSMPSAEDQEWAAWHFEHSLLPTVSIRNAGVLYMNPYHNDEKDIRDRVVVAARVFPALGSWRAVAFLLLDALLALAKGRGRLASKNARTAWRLAANRVRPREYTSSYF